ncbi:MAG: glutamate racemase [Patescibacteria group bacterium]
MIGIFDSGIGGLTVAREVLRLLPEYQILYFGDTARTPYGNKSRDTIVRYAVEDTELLLKHGATVVVVACNTASAVAAAELKKRYPTIPIFEVITPAVKRGTEVTRNKRIGVIGTRATIESRIYEDTIKHKKNGYTIVSKACPLFVPLAEEGWEKKPAAKLIAQKYLRPMKNDQIDTLILGCTHYPLLRDVIQQKIGKRVTLVDPAEQTILLLREYLRQHPDTEARLTRSNQHQFLFSDIPPHLTQLIERWLGQPVKPKISGIPNEAVNRTR